MFTKSVSFAFFFVLGVSILSIEANLAFQAFDPPIPCADGSPAGIYVEQNQKIPLDQSQNHVIVFIGGGACKSPEDCKEGYEMEPFKFSTSFNPKKINGDTVLSNDPKINVMHAYTKWLVPYCSQDFFLGDVKKGKIGEFTHAGSVIFDAAVSYWKEQVMKSNNSSFETTHRLDTVAVLGLSAGAIGLMNKVDKVRDAVNSVGTQKLRILLDSPTVLNDRPNDEYDFNAAMLTYTDLLENPLCDPSHFFSRLYTRASIQPCCLSVHCMLRHDTRLSSFFTPQVESHISDSAREELLILDSAYDTFSVITGTSLVGDDKDSEDETNADKGRNHTNQLWYTAEVAGSRKARATETASVMKLTLPNEQPSENSFNLHENRVQWIFTSCVTHTFLVPAVEFLFLSCDHGDYDDENFNFVCQPDGFAMEFEADALHLKIRVWRTTETWWQVEFEGKSIQSIISDFVLDKSLVQDPTLALLFGEEVVDLRLKQCSGPNCLEAELPTSTQPSCQSLIELDNVFAPIPITFQIVWTIIIFLVVSCLFLRVRPPMETSIPSKLKKTARTRTSTFFQQESLTSSGAHFASKEFIIRGISVITSTGVSLLDNVDVPMTIGSVTAICGHCGCGKSTLLRTINQLQQHNMSTSIVEGALELEKMKKAFLRQYDSTSFGNLTPMQFLLYNARIYGTPESIFKEVCLLGIELLKSGSVDNQSTEQDRANTLFETRMEHLSGGQRRIVSVVSSLLLDPSLLLLDEPLSGLDTLSGLQVLDAVRFIVKRRPCIVFMSVHQPSEAVLEVFNRLICMDNGRVAFILPISGIDSAKLAHKKLETHFSNKVRRSVAASVLPVGFNLDSEIMRAISADELTGHEIENNAESSKHSRALSTGGASMKDDYEQNPETHEGLSERRNESPSRRSQTRRQYLSKHGSAGSSCRSQTSPESVKRTSRLSVAWNNSWFSTHSYVTIEVASNTADNTLNENQEQNESDNNKENLHIQFPVEETKALHVHGHFQGDIKQIRPLIRRTQLELQWDFSDILTTLCVFIIAAALLRFETTFTLQVVLSTVLMVGAPVIIFPHKLLEYSQLWTAHRQEMEDGQVSLLAFQLATYAFTLPVPILSVVIGIISIYAILGWSYDTFLVQCLFSVTHLLVPLQFGRVLLVNFSGKITPTIKVYTIVIFLFLCFSSVPVASHKVPWGLRWLIYLSTNFWAISGAVQNQFDNEHYSNDNECFDFVSCILSDGSLIVSHLGFAPMSTSYLAMTILTCLFVGLALLEQVSLRLYFRKAVFK